MFDYSIAHWATFFSAAFLLTISPGPDLAFILAQTSKHGKQMGFQAMYGIWTGALLHVFLAAFGLSAILATSATAFSLVKLLGAAYLVYLGAMSIFSQSKPNADITPQSQLKPFRQGMVVAALNPKTAMFFLSFLPQFTVAGAGAIPAQLFLHGVLVILMGVIIEPILVLASSRLGGNLMNNPRASQWLDRAVGSVFIGLGLRLAFTAQD